MIGQADLEDDRDRIDPNIGTVPTGVETDIGGSESRASWRSDVVNVLRGFCMGAADTVPGVSGGTVALILGHYHRLVTAISLLDYDAVRMLTGRRWKEAWQHVDGRFLAGIGTGIGVGIVTLAGIMHWLLDAHLPETFAVFFGLILASVVIVARSMDRWTPNCFVACVIGMVAAFAIGWLTPTVADDFSLLYLFVSGAVAICAMILPGISGAFVLLLFGVYHPVTGAVKEMAKGNIDAAAITQIGAVAAGCLFGLLTFTRILRWLLDRHPNMTMASLIGLMLGSTVKLWPLQVPTEATKN